MLLVLITQSATRAQPPPELSHQAALTHQLAETLQSPAILQGLQQTKCKPATFIPWLKLHQMPDVVGCPYPVIAKSFREFKLPVPGLTQESSSYSKGLIYKQDRPSGGKIMPGEQVMLTISSGPEPVPKVPEPLMTTVPYVSGFTRAAAVTQIENKHLQARLGGDEYTTTRPSGTVSRTDPQTPAQVAQGTTVTYWLSLGPPVHEPLMTTVPYVSGFTRAAALEGIKNRHLQASFGGDEYTATRPSGTVSHTDPQALASVAQGTMVKYWISLGPPMRQRHTAPPVVEVPDVTGKTPEQAALTLQRAGLAAGQPIPELTLSGSGLISRQEPPARSSLPQSGMVLLWRPYAWFSVTNLVVVSLLVLIVAGAAVFVRVLRKQRLAYTRRVVSMRASIQRKDEVDPVPSVPLGRPLIAMRTRLEPGGLVFQDPVVIERREIQHD